MSCNYCVGNCFEIFFDILRCFLYFPQLISLFDCPWITITIYIKFILINFKSKRFYHLIQGRRFFDPILLTHTVWNLSCIYSHCRSSYNVNIWRSWFWGIFLVIFIEVETHFMFNKATISYFTILPFGAYGCCHINIDIFRIWSSDVVE